MQYVFNAWNEICRKIARFRQKLLLLDYDGTLTPIVDIPEMANLAIETRSLLAGLTYRPSVKVGIISGRALSDIKERVGMGGLIYAGNHGFEIESADIRFVHPLTEEISSVIRVIHTVLQRTMSGIKGVIVEDKGITLSVHYRMVEKEKMQTVNSMFENTVGLARNLGKIKVMSGKKVHEIRPAVSWNKGNAVDLIYQKLSNRQRKGELLVLYLGDDLTDEDAFSAVNDLGGISVLVGEHDRISAADYYLNSTAEVNSFLTELSKII